jgi:hypothetical protein
MYNKYTYDFSKPTATNNLNMIDCFEDINPEDQVDINKILDDINSKFMEQIEQMEQKVKEKVKEQKVKPYNKYKR